MTFTATLRIQNAYRARKARDRVRVMRASAHTFNKFDIHGKGFLDRRALRQMLRELGKKLTQRQFEEYLAKVDADGDGEVSLDEFMGAMREGQHPVMLAESDVRKTHGGQVISVHLPPGPLYTKVVPGPQNAGLVVYGFPPEQGLCHRKSRETQWTSDCRRTLESGASEKVLGEAHIRSGDKTEQCRESERR